MRDGGLGKLQRRMRRFGDTVGQREFSVPRPLPLTCAGSCRLAKQTKRGVVEPR